MRDFFWELHRKREAVDFAGNCESSRLLFLCQNGSVRCRSPPVTGIFTQTQISNEIGGTDMRTIKIQYERLWPAAAQTQTGLWINTGGILRRDRDQRYLLPED